MASSACQKLPPLAHLIPDRGHHHHHPRHSLLPFPASPSAHPDPPPSTSFPQSFFLFPSPSMTYAPFARSVIEGAAHVRPLPDQELESAESSSISSCFMSSNSDDDEDDTGSSSTSSLSQFESPSLDAEGPLDNLTSLCAALPIKRGLSRYFSGKSQSFSSLVQVSSVTDLAKPENPFVKRRRMAGTGADSLPKHHSYPPRCASSAGISKRPTTTSNRYNKSLKCLPRTNEKSLEGHVKSSKHWPAKCFSVPEF